MTGMLTGYVNPRELENEIERAEQKLGPEVVRVRHNVGPDTSGEPAIHFRIVLTDAASREETLAEVADRIDWILLNELRPHENWGMRLYTRFRSKSEQAMREHLDLEWV